MSDTRLAFFEAYRRAYYHGPFLRHRGTEVVLSTIRTFAHEGSWIDLGAGPTTLLWSLAFDRVSSIVCNDVEVEALAVLDRFWTSDEIPKCYLGVLDELGLSTGTLEARRAITPTYAVFDVSREWPSLIDDQVFDTVTQIGTFGVQPSAEAFVRCLRYTLPHLRSGGRLIGANWIRHEIGIDRSYLRPSLITELGHTFGVHVANNVLVRISGDETFDAVLIWVVETR